MFHAAQEIGASHLDDAAARVLAERVVVQQLQLGDIAAAATLDDHDKGVISDALEPLGVTTLQQSAADASQSLSDARELLARGQTILAPMLTSLLLKLTYIGAEWVLWLLLILSVTSIAFIVDSTNMKRVMSRM